MKSFKGKEVVRPTGMIELWSSDRYQLFLGERKTHFSKDKMKIRLKRMTFLNSLSSSSRGSETGEMI
jgi:hypothetical protein